MPIPASRALVPFRPFLIVQTDRERRIRPVIREAATRQSCLAVLTARRRTITSRFFDYDVRVFEHGRLRFRMRPFSQSGPWAPLPGLSSHLQDDDDC